jgi:double-stranded uracil-DNA glycosylase
MRHACFPPVTDDRTETLILGSLPGAASLAVARYYAHPQNQFWRLVGAVIGTDLPGLSYEERLATLLAHHIGLWDVVAEAERPGSLDAAIRAPVPNDLLALVRALPRLQTIAFNGGTAARIGRARLGDAADRYRLLALPSSSPAYTLPFAAKVGAWRGLVSSPSPRP